MGCGCGSNRKRSPNVGPARPSRTTYQVVMDGGNGRVAFTTSNEPLANSVSRSYAGSIVRPLGAVTTPSET
ncbi:hypothetical protein QF027_004633 [Streptomyces canus]|nr:hypothetical protein [Streptomyces canus]